MLGFLPQPIGDELLYSMLARYRELSASTTSKPTMDAAFGGDGRYANVGLPGRLRTVAVSLPGKKWTAERLASDHTLLPYYERLVPARIRDRLRAGLLDGWTTGGMDGLSPYLGSVTQSRTLNFCPECVAADVLGGMAAWRRVHQLPGVFICPEHLTPLRTTDISALNQAQLLPCPADPGTGRPVLQLLHDGAAASVARNSLWLLEHGGLPIDPAALRAGVRAMMRDAGWITETNMVRAGIRDAVAEKLGSSRLEALGCRLGLVGNRDAWLGWLWEKRPEIRAHPLRYLLFLAFLGRDAADLFAFEGQEIPDEPAVVLNQRRADIVRRAVPSRPAIIEQHRRTVLAMIAAKPQAGRTELRNSSQRPFVYLARHDPVWLEENLPPEMSKAKARDWSDMDATLLPLVEGAIARMRGRPGRPVRITATGIAIESGNKATLLNNAERLPLCTAAAEAASENDVLFARRRLDWAANEMVIRGDGLQWAKFATFSKLNGPWRPALDTYARDLFDRMVLAVPGKAMFPVRGPDWPEEGASPAGPDLDRPVPGTARVANKRPFGKEA